MPFFTTMLLLSSSRKGILVTPSWISFWNRITRNMISTPQKPFSSLPLNLPYSISIPTFLGQPPFSHQPLLLFKNPLPKLSPSSAVSLRNRTPTFPLVSPSVFHLRIGSLLHFIKPLGMFHHFWLDFHSRAFQPTYNQFGIFSTNELL